MLPRTPLPAPSHSSPLQTPPATSVLLQGHPRTAHKTLWLFPDGSGLATSYLSLPDIDINSLAVFGLNSPFIKRTDGMSAYTFSDLTSAYVTELRRRQPTGPYWVGGWSAGGISAYEAAQQLVAAGEAVERLVLLDAPNPVGLAKLPARLYDEFNARNLFGSEGAAAGGSKEPPAWLLSHFLGFIEILDTFVPRAWDEGEEGRKKKKLPTWILWAGQGVDEKGEIPIHEDDPVNMRWLLQKRKGEDLGPNGWDRLVRGEDITIQVLEEANHFNMMDKSVIGRVSRFIKEALA